MYISSEQDFRLAYRGVRLADDKTLRELGLPDEASLVCILTTPHAAAPAAAAATTPGVQAAAAAEDEREKAKAEEERQLAEQERAISAIEVR